MSQSGFTAVTFLATRISLACLDTDTGIGWMRSVASPIAGGIAMARSHSTKVDKRPSEPKSDHSGDRKVARFFFTLTVFEFYDIAIFDDIFSSFGAKFTLLTSFRITSAI